MCGPKPAPEAPSSLQRIARLPVVDVALSIYVRVKHLTPAPMRWGLDKAEGSAFYIVGRFDPILCKGLDVLESRAETTHRYVQETIVKPVILRAGSVTEFSIKQANTCMDLADRYVDTYLPPIEKEASNKATTMDHAGTTMQAIHRADRLGRKLQRRLTERTLSEMRAFRHAGVEIIRWFADIAELLARDPKAFLERVKAGWRELSLPEPENQARPKTLEELIALLVRESARRIVHISNHAYKIASDLSVKVKHFAQERAQHIKFLLKQLYNHAEKILEQLACSIAGRQNYSNSAICPRPTNSQQTTNSSNNSSGNSKVVTSPPKKVSEKNSSRSGD